MPMINRWFTRLLCLSAVVGIVLAMGCGRLSAERKRRYRYVIRTDLQHMWRDMEWIVGLDEPSIVYEDSFPPP